MTGTNNTEKAPSAPYVPSPRKRAQGVAFEDRFYRIISLGTIVSGVFACLVSVGIGMGLLLAGTVILAEL